MNRQDATSAKEPDQELDKYASNVIRCAVEVHRLLGPGFLESVYERALCVELGLQGVPFQAQVPLSLEYKGQVIADARVDLVVVGRLVVELKAVDALAPIHLVQVRSYLKAMDCMLGLLINFNVAVLLRGVRRVILSR